MADKIDKALTQEPRKELNIPGQEEIQEAVEQEIAVEQSKKGPVEVQEEDDGSVTVDFDPNAASPEGGDEHYANLAEFLEDHVLDELGSILHKNIWTTTCPEKIGNNLIQRFRSFRFQI